MRLLARMVWLVLLAYGITGCVREPRTLVWHKHACDFCKMTLVDDRYGALLETEKGRVYRFDDISCMLKYGNQHFPDFHEVQVRLVVDFSHPGKLIPAEEAFYLKSEKLVTPMESNIASFGSKTEFDRHKKKLKGIYLVWGELITQFK